MACFYAMDELKLPFKQYILFDADPATLVKTKDPDIIKLSDGKEIALGPAKVRSDGELSPYGFFTLRVCKGCRSDWMHAIKKWFNESPSESRIGSGIFVRDYGTNREISEDEWSLRSKN